MLHPYNLSVAWARKYGFDESREQVLRALLAGVPYAVIQRFENRRRSLATVLDHERAIVNSLGRVDGWLYHWLRKRNGRTWTEAVKTAARRRVG